MVKSDFTGGLYMQCPNCGRNVRSKRQCAHCGYVFDKNDRNQKVTPEENINAPKEFKEVTITPKTPKKREGGLGKFIWGLVKLMIMLALVFLAFLFGPQLVKKASQFINGDSQVAQAPNKNQESTQSVGQEASELTSVEESSQTSQNQDASTIQSETETSSKEDSNQSSTSQSENSSDQESSESADNEDQTPSLTLKKDQVTLDKYPIVSIALEFEDTLQDVNRDTFKFKLKSNGQDKSIGDEYSLIKEGKTLKISFNDPSANVLSAEDQEQILTIEAPSLDFKEEVKYQLPKNNLDPDQSDQFNQIIDENISENGEVSAIIKDLSAENNVSFAYDNQTVDADALISWFVLARMYEALDQDLLQKDQEITIHPDLIASGDEGELANAEEGATYSVESLMRLVIQQQDASAMNHLLQEIGGPNDFNLWLNESDYFSTKVTAKLAINENGGIDGAVTNAKDLSLLMESLANNKLVNEELDGQFKEELLQTPMSNKYPEGNLAQVMRRYEITSADSNTKNQYYSAIIETEENPYILVILASNVDASEASIDGIRQTVQECVDYLTYGEVAPETTVEMTEEPVTEATEAPIEHSQVQIIGEDNNTVTEATPEYTVQYIEGRGEIQLPVIKDEAGNPIQVQWYWNEEAQRYEYY